MLDIAFLGSRRDGNLENQPNGLREAPESPESLGSPNANVDELFLMDGDGMKLLLVVSILLLLCIAVFVMRKKSNKPGPSV